MRLSRSHCKILPFLIFLLSILASIPASAKAPTANHALAPIAGLEIISEVAERCTGGVVNISSTRVVTTRDRGFSPFFNDPFFREFFGQDFFGVPRKKREKSLGSGVIIEADGLVLTSSHVVEGADEIIVTLADKRELKAEIVGIDPRSDVAVVRLQGNPAGLQPIPLGDSTTLRLGEVVLAIGNPFGLSHTVTMGIVSAKGRADMGIVDYEDFIQTDAAINPGNSGGALINLRGELVGINTAILSRSGGYQGIGFAIPVNLARAVMTNLIRSGKVIRGWLGVTVQDLDPALAGALGLTETGGVLISAVTPGSSAAAAGLKRGQVIRKFNDEVISSAARFRQKVAAFGAGSNIELEVSDNDRSRKIKLTLEEIPAPPPGSTVDLPVADGPLGGITLAPVTELTREQFYLPAQLLGGAVITAVKPASPADQAGLRAGDVLLELNKKELADPADFLKRYRALSRQDQLLLIYRAGSTFYLVLRR
jgi:serine protease Do